MLRVHLISSRTSRVYIYIYMCVYCSKLSTCTYIVTTAHTSMEHVHRWHKEEARKEEETSKCQYEREIKSSKATGRDKGVQHLPDFVCLKCQETCKVVYFSESKLAFFILQLCCCYIFLGIGIHILIFKLAISSKYFTIFKAVIFSTLITAC